MTDHYRRCDRPTHVYTVALILDTESLEHALLQVKARPEWQMGLLNGPGGKVERGEGPLDCIHREVREETGLQPGNFTLLARLHCTTPSDPYSLVYFYRATLPFHILWAASRDEANEPRFEPLRLVRVGDLAPVKGMEFAHPNLSYLFQMARNAALNAGRANFFDIYEEYRPAHEWFGGGY